MSETLHEWKRHEDGDINIMAYEKGFCNGPACVRCGAEFCHHCNPQCYEEPCPAADPINTHAPHHNED